MQVELKGVKPSHASVVMRYNEKRVIDLVEKFQTPDFHWVVVCGYRMGHYFLDKNPVFTYFDHNEIFQLLDRLKGLNESDQQKTGLLILFSNHSKQFEVVGKNLGRCLVVSEEDGEFYEPVYVLQNTMNKGSDLERKVMYLLASELVKGGRGDVFVNQNCKEFLDI